jgi:hypothetical protein
MCDAHIFFEGKKEDDIFFVFFFLLPYFLFLPQNILRDSQQFTLCLQLGDTQFSAEANQQNTLHLSLQYLAYISLFLNILCLYKLSLSLFIVNLYVTSVHVHSTTQKEEQQQPRGNIKT